jgi:small GTP-binding protein
MTDYEDYDILLKAIILGDSSVGKTNLLTRYTEDRYDEFAKNTIGLDLKTKVCRVKDRGVKINIFDTAGQERFRSLTPVNFQKVDIVVLVYDITRRSTFERMPAWLEMVRLHCQPSVIILVIGNKTDLKDVRSVTGEEGGRFADQCDGFFFETSAKTNENGSVQKAFDGVIQKAAEEYIKAESDNEATLQKERSELMESIRLRELSIGSKNLAVQKKRFCC